MESPTLMMAGVPCFARMVGLETILISPKVSRAEITEFNENESSNPFNTRPLVKFQDSRDNFVLEPGVLARTRLQSMPYSKPLERVTSIILASIRIWRESISLKRLSSFDTVLTTDGLSFIYRLPDNLLMATRPPSDLTLAMSSSRIT